MTFVGNFIVVYHDCGVWLKCNATIHYSDLKASLLLQRIAKLNTEWLDCISMYDSKWKLGCYPGLVENQDILQKPRLCSSLHVPCISEVTFICHSSTSLSCHSHDKTQNTFPRSSHSLFCLLKALSIS